MSAICDIFTRSLPDYIFYHSPQARFAFEHHVGHLPWIAFTSFGVLFYSFHTHLFSRLSSCKRAKMPKGNMTTTWHSAGLSTSTEPIPHGAHGAYTASLVWQKVWWVASLQYTWLGPYLCANWTCALCQVDRTALGCNIFCRGAFRTRCVVPHAECEF